MQVEHPGRVHRARDDKASPTKRITPAKAQKTISAASIFKQSSRKMKQTNAILPAALSVRSPQKVQKRPTRRRSNLHPLVVAFKDSSHDYRHNLYTTTKQKINRTLDSLLNRLHESSMQTVLTQLEPDGSQTSPLRLTAPAKYERLATRLYQPLSQYKLSLSTNDRKGERVRFETTLATRMQDYEDHLAQSTEEVERLQKQWEAVVGEIWKLGLSCLGKETMTQLLVTKEGMHATAEPSSELTRLESPLFVAEQGSTSPPQDERRGKKRVTFKTPSDQEKQADNLAFLNQASRYKKGTLLLAPSLPEEDARELAKEIKELGKKEMEELQKISRDKRQFWKRKTNQIMQSLAGE